MHAPNLSLFKQIRMGPRSFKDDFITFDFIDQEPVRLDMAFAPIFEIADELMVLVFNVQILLSHKLCHDRLELFYTFLLAQDFFKVLFKLLGSDRF